MSARLGIRSSVAAVVLLLLAASIAHAQGSITGVVRDESGAVLPGVTVEASSPALIEKVRTATTDSGGQYRVVDLRPGLYTVTYALAGFGTVRREGIELTGSFTASVNVVLKVGGLEESVTVTGESPVVDVQSARQERVLGKEVMDAVPTSRYYAQMVALVPGVSLSGGFSGGVSLDVGGTAGDSQSKAAIHGGWGDDQRVMINGIDSSGTTNNNPTLGANLAAMEEISITTGGADASQDTGGIRVNMVPREGGNTFKGNLFFTGTGDAMQGNNLTSDLIGRGLTSTNSLKLITDLQAAFGGPIKKDRLWFFVNGRHYVTQNYQAGLFYNATPEAWTYTRSTQQAYTDALVKGLGGRVTWQVNAKNKLSLAHDDRSRCTCPNFRSSASSPEASFDQPFNPSNITAVNWTSPLTSRVLVEAGLNYVHDEWNQNPPDLPAADSKWAVTRQDLVGVIEQRPAPGTPVEYRGLARAGTPWIATNSQAWKWAASVSYVTGAHAVKVGYRQNREKVSTEFTGPNPLNYVYVFTSGVPTALNLYSSPWTQYGEVSPEIGLYAQDKWTRGKLTLTGGVRYDHVKMIAPATHLGPSLYTPARDFTIPEQVLANFNDIVPRVSAAYDLTGDGRTALKVSLNKYVNNVSLGTTAPAVAAQTSAARAWTDANNNKIPDCDLTNPGLQDLRSSGGDLCGAYTGPSVNFGKTRPSVINDPTSVSGWGNRGYNWEFSAGVQRQLAPNVSLDLTYFRRWYGNFTLTDNLAVSASDYSPFSVTAPANPRLPDGGGYTVAGYMNVNPAAATRTPDQHKVLVDDSYGKWVRTWNGLDVTTSARPGAGVMLQGGLSIGRSFVDTCEVLAKVPEAAPLTSPSGTVTTPSPTDIYYGHPYCRQQQNWQTQLKLMGTYQVPRIDVSLAATLQSYPGPEITADYVATNAQVQPSLGRPLAGNAATVTVPIIAPGTMYGQRVNQVDLRVGKVLRFGARRLIASVDLYNALNTDAPLGESATYSIFRTPLSVASARFAKFTVQFDF